MSNNNVKPSTNNDSLAEMAKRIRELEEANAKLKANMSRGGKLSLKVSEKGALSVYGMGRFPVTLYKSQWETLLAEATVGTIKEFIKVHETELKTKEQASTGVSVTAPSATAPKAPEAGKAF